MMPRFFSTFGLGLKRTFSKKFSQKNAKQTIFKNNPPNSGHLGKFTCNSYQTVSLQTSLPPRSGRHHYHEV
jgi:hypothetical protein